MSNPPEPEPPIHPAFHSKHWPYVCTHNIPANREKCLCGNYMRVEVPESEKPNTTS